MCWTTVLDHVKMRIQRNGGCISIQPSSMNHQWINEILLSFGKTYSATWRPRRLSSLGQRLGCMSCVYYSFKDCRRGIPTFRQKDTFRVPWHCLVKDPRLYCIVPFCCAALMLQVTQRKKSLLLILLVLIGGCGCGWWTRRSCYFLVFLSTTRMLHIIHSLVVQLFWRAAVGHVNECKGYDPGREIQQYGLGGSEFRFGKWISIVMKGPSSRSSSSNSSRLSCRCSTRSGTAGRECRSSDHSGRWRQLGGNCS